MSEARQEQKQAFPLEFLTITGPLPGGRYLTRPLNVKIMHDEGEVIISEPYFHIHAAGTTLSATLAEFRRILTEELDDLTKDEEEPGPRLQAELRYLRNLIGTA